jgi:hypothetical protein
LGELLERCGFDADEFRGAVDVVVLKVFGHRLLDRENASRRAQRR